MCSSSTQTEAFMRAGLAGFAGSGKTSLFNALTGLKRGAEKRLHRLRQERDSGGETHELQRVAKHLEQGAPLRTLTMSEAEEQALAHFGFLSRRPLLVVVNVAESDAARPVPAALQDAAAGLGADAIALSAGGGAQVARLPAGEQPEDLAALGRAATRA